MYTQYHKGLSMILLTSLFLQSCGNPELDSKHRMMSGGGEDRSAQDPHALANSLREQSSAAQAGTAEDGAQALNALLEAMNNPNVHVATVAVEELGKLVQAHPSLVTQEIVEALLARQEAIQKAQAEIEARRKKADTVTTRAELDSLRVRHGHLLHQGEGGQKQDEEHQDS